MFNLFCDHCGSNIYYDQLKTLAHYRAESKKLPVDVFPYLVYICSGCGLEFRYRFEDIERKERERLTKIINDERILSEANHLVYCGGCSGVNGKGECFEYIYNKCPKGDRAK